MNPVRAAPSYPRNLLSFRYPPGHATSRSQRVNQSLRSFRGLLPLCGIVAPILFTLAVIVFGFLREDYSHMEHEISELGAIGSPNMAGLNASIVFTGLLILAFSFGLYRGAGPGKSVKVGSLLLSLTGFGMAVAGVFPADLSCPSPTCNSVASNGHAVGALMVFLPTPFAVLFLSRGLGRDTAWRRYRLAVWESCTWRIFGQASYLRAP